MTQDDMDKIRHHVAELVTLLKMDGTGSAVNLGFRRYRPGQPSTFASAPNPGLQNLPKATMPAYTDPAASQGHDPVHQGLQKHSIGDTYPWAVVGIANGDKVHYEVHNLCTGQRVYMIQLSKPFRYNAEGALERASALAEGRKLPEFLYLAE